MSIQPQIPGITAVNLLDFKLSNTPAMPALKPKKVYKKKPPADPEDIVYTIELKIVESMLKRVIGGSNCWSKIREAQTLAIFKKFLKQELKGLVDDAAEIAAYRTFPQLIGQDNGEYESEQEETEEHNFRYKHHCQPCTDHWINNHNIQQCLQNDYVKYCHTHSKHGPKECLEQCSKHMNKGPLPEMVWGALNSPHLEFATHGPLPSVPVNDHGVPLDSWRLDFQDFKAMCGSGIYGNISNIDDMFPAYNSVWHCTGGTDWTTWGGYHKMTKKGIVNTDKEYKEFYVSFPSLEELEALKTTSKKKVEGPDEFDLTYNKFIEEAKAANVSNLKALYPAYHCEWIEGPHGHLYGGGHFHMTKKLDYESGAPLDFPNYN